MSLYILRMHEKLLRDFKRKKKRITRKDHRTNRRSKFMGNGQNWTGLVSSSQWQLLSRSLFLVRCILASKLQEIRDICQTSHSSSTARRLPHHGYCSYGEEEHHPLPYDETKCSMLKRCHWLSTWRDLPLLLRHPRPSPPAQAQHSTVPALLRSALSRSSVNLRQPPKPPPQPSTIPIRTPFTTPPASSPRLQISKAREHTQHSYRQTPNPPPNPSPI